ncbi:hypothetical protein [Cochleicola gelatinilyticus]|uniref:hypothetical protein n=1 Tax=Cochleicola gelatinilyticus TaxID=1763537 RepID=UPI0012FA50EE|nr:hypothetical protein [Cochleicola gelatinilyticus]
MNTLLIVISIGIVAVIGFLMISPIIRSNKKLKNKYLKDKEQHRKKKKNDKNRTDTK